MDHYIPISCRGNTLSERDRRLLAVVPRGTVLQVKCPTCDGIADGVVALLGAAQIRPHSPPKTGKTIAAAHLEYFYEDEVDLFG